MDVYEVLFDKLSAGEFDVYPPATKVGECTSPYIVLKMDGGSSYSSFSTDIAYYSVLVYVPKNSYSSLDGLMLRVKNWLKDLYPLVQATGIVTPSFYDDTYKAHMSSMQYKIYRKQ